ncbi:MAG TPA: HAMP domain-containing sensor histidine kinase [Anaerolineales bacterium]|nr:HAMP domain-containing sensor histidine kinase [Anaerolineales bacterium]
MTAQELLNKIRDPWTQRVSQTLARGSGVRESFEQQLIRFFDLMEQAVLTGDSGWLDSILYDWARSPTETDLDQGQYHVAFVMNQMISLTIEVARETLEEQDALDLIATIIPVFTYGVEVVSRYEMETRVAHISNEMTDVQKKMEQLDRSKSNFIAVAAHELKTPLTLIEGYTSMMRDMMSEESGVDNLLQGVNIGIQRLRQIVDDMIDVSLIDNHLLSLNWQPIQMAQLLDLLRLEVQPTANQRHQELVIEKFSGSETWIYADPERIYQALRNVMNNAIKFTPDNGKVCVNGRTLPGFIEITVADTGIGISPEDQTLIFEKFGQIGKAELHSSGKTKFKGGGPGLGLAISRGIVEAHGGTIWVESEGYDEKNLPGSTFHILLPSRTEAGDPRITKLFEGLEQSKTQPNVQENTGTNDPAA